MRSFWLCGACVLLAVLFGGPAFAAEKAGEGAFRLGEIEVVEQADGSPNVSVQRVTEETMRTFNTDTVDRAVNLLPGVTVSHVGARNEKMVYVRGFDLKHVPIYMDGIPIYVPYDGYPDLGRFTTFDLANITVSKGFASVLHGPNTMGGAINMVSKRPSEKFEAVTGLGVGSYTYNGYLNMGTNLGLWYVQAGLSHLNSDGFPLSRSLDSVPTENGGRRNNSYHQDSKGSLKVGFTPNSKDEYALTYAKQHGKKGTPPYAGESESISPRYWKWPYWDRESVYFNSETWFGEDVYAKTRLYYDVFENALESYDDASYSTMRKRSSFKSAYDDHTYGGSVELGLLAIPRNELRLAVHFKRDFHKELAPKTPDVHFQEDIFSVGLEDTINFTDSFYAIAGVGYDRVKTREAENLVGKTVTDFSRGSADAVNPQLGLFYKVGEAGLAHASVALKSRMPSIKDKFSYRMGRAIPNPDLDPERAVNYEIGYKHSFEERVTVEGNLFYSDVRDYILFKTVPDPDNPGKRISQNQNIGEVDMYGLELGVTARIFDPLRGGINYTWLEYENHTNDDELLDTPRHKIFAFLEYSPLERLSLLADMEYNSKRYSSTDGERVADGFTVFGVKGTYEFLEKKYLELGLNNAFDADYELSEGYPQAGRTWFANLRMEF